MSEQRPSPSPSDVGSMRLSRTRTRKRPRAFAEDDSENEFSRRPPSSELPLRNSASSSAVVPGTDQLAIPAAAQASSLSQLGLSNIYSTSGFDTLGILARLYMRPSPRVDLGPIDCSSSFIVVDAKDVNGDNPIIYVSENFTKLTGYGLHEVLGRNCRFLQAPDGIVRKGSIRKFVDNATILEIKNCVEQFQEASFTQINYKKGGTPFVNMITIVPLAWDSDEIKYFVGFQVDLEDQSRRILKRMFEGTYLFPGSRTRGRALEASTITELDAEDDQDKTERKSYTRQAKKRTKTGSRETVVSEQGSPAGAGAKLGLADFVSTALRPSLGVGTTLASPPTLSLAEIQQMADPETSLQNPSGLFKLEQASPYATFETFAPSPSEPSMMPSPSVAPSPAISLDAPMFVPIADDSETVELPEEEEEDDAVLDDEEIDEEDGDEDEDFFQPAKRSSKATASKGRRARASAIPQPTARNGRRPQGEQGDEIATGILSPRNLAENQSDFTFILSSRGIFLFGTAEGCMRTVGFDANDLVGRTLADLVHPHDVPSVARELRACRPGYRESAFCRLLRRK